jgi:arginase family enzyme
MNRIVIVGNGFDIAHNLKTKYEDFLYDYFIKAIIEFEQNWTYEDELIKLISRNFPKYHLGDTISDKLDNLNQILQCDEIIKTLPEKVYLSIDIDGLDPKLCPNTGTPVPGGFEFEQVVYLIQQLVEAKKQIIAFDINEVAPGKDEWDANVGARLLYKVSNMCLVSNGVKA